MGACADECTEVVRGNRMCVGIFINMSRRVRNFYGQSGNGTGKGWPGKWWATKPEQQGGWITIFKNIQRLARGVPEPVFWIDFV